MSFSAAIGKRWRVAGLLFPVIPQTSCAFPCCTCGPIGADMQRLHGRGTTPIQGPGNRRPAKGVAAGSVCGGHGGGVDAGANAPISRTRQCRQTPQPCLRTPRQCSAQATARPQRHSRRDSCGLVARRTLLLRTTQNRGPGAGRVRNRAHGACFSYFRVLRCSAALFAPNTPAARLHASVPHGTTNGSLASTEPHQEAHKPRPIRTERTKARANPDRSHKSPPDTFRSFMQTGWPRNHRTQQETTRCRTSRNPTSRAPGCALEKP